MKLKHREEPRKQKSGNTKARSWCFGDADAEAGVETRESRPKRLTPQVPSTPYTQSGALPRGGGSACLGERSNPWRASPESGQHGCGWTLCLDQESVRPSLGGASTRSCRNKLTTIGGCLSILRRFQPAICTQVTQLTIDCRFVGLANEVGEERSRSSSELDIITLWTCDRRSMWESFNDRFTPPRSLGEMEMFAIDRL